MAGIASSVRKAVAGMSSALAWLAVAGSTLGGAMSPLERAMAQVEPPPVQPESATEQAPSVPQPSPPESDTAAAATPGDRAAAYRTFREHFDARRFAEALPAGQQIVDLTEQRYGQDAIELVAPLLNLGTTKLRLNDFNGAAVQYQRALKIVEAREGAFSRDIIAPLLGLGISYASAGDYDASAQALRRAVDVSRKLDGLFNVAQLDLVETLVASYVALNQYEDAEREQQYALRLAEAAYGRNDPRLIPALERSARWLENAGHFVTARQAYARALEIARISGGDKDPRMVTPLRGIARMYRMEYLYGAELQNPVSSANSSHVSGSVYGSTSAASVSSPGMLNDSGEEALEIAIGVLDANPDAALAERGDTLVDLGDWYMVAGRTRNAMRAYKDAWNALSAPGARGTAALDAPSQLIYRPPSSARRNPTVEPEEYTEHFVEVQFTVTAEGRARDVSIVSDDVAESTGKGVVTAIRRARYRPRIADGAPVATKGVRHRQIVYVRT